MDKKKVTVLITDLDNTLYDWFQVWHSSFRAMLDSLVQQSGISEDELIPEIKKIHEQHGTSEFSMLLEELPALQNKHKDKNISEIYRKTIDVYWNERANNLKLYPEVLETLQSIKNQGCFIIGYTDSQTLYTEFRVKELGLDGVLDKLYSSPNHIINDVYLERKLFFPVYNSLEKTICEQTPVNASKPNPEVLKSIIDSNGISPSEVVYVGDSLINDISMAQAVPVKDVYAKFGLSHHKEEYELLRNVTHWKPEKVEREKSIEITPSYVLDKSFSQLFDFFQFDEFKK